MNKEKDIVRHAIDTSKRGLEKGIQCVSSIYDSINTYDTKNISDIEIVITGDKVINAVFKISKIFSSRVFSRYGYLASPSKGFRILSSSSNADENNSLALIGSILATCGPVLTQISVLMGLAIALKVPLEFAFNPNNLLTLKDDQFIIRFFFSRRAK